MDDAEYRRRREARDARRAEVEAAAGFHPEVKARAWSRVESARWHQVPAERRPGALGKASRGRRRSKR